MVNKIKLFRRSPYFVNVGIFAAAFAVIGGATLLLSSAATTKVIYEAESSNVSGSLAVLADNDASGGSYVEFGVESPGWNGYEKPGANNTGPTNRNNLTNVTNSQLEDMMTDGAVIENVNITGGDVDIVANNVTIRNFVLNANGNRYGFVSRTNKTGLTLEDGEIYNMSSASILGMGFTARRLNIHDSGGDGIKAQSTGSVSGPVLVESSWIHRLGKNDGAHADGDQSRSGPSPIVFRGNNCDMPVNEKGGPGAPYKSNACFILAEAEGPLVSFTAEYNWLNGGNFTVYCGGEGSNNYFRYNRFGRGYRYGTRSGTCDVWEGNVWDDNEEAVN